MDEVLERFWDKVEVDPITKCWNWISALQERGYSLFWTKHKSVLAHRFAYEVNKSKIPDGLTIDHLCRNHGCVNPDHLEVVTIKENVLRGIGPTAQNNKKTTCPLGHLYDGYDNRGYRTCSKCIIDKKHLRMKIK